MADDEWQDALVPKLVKINAKPAPLEVDLARTAVIVVDMQNAFLSEGGMFDQAGYDISRPRRPSGETPSFSPFCVRQGSRSSTS